MSLLPPRPRRIATYDLHGWDAIADYLGVSVRSARRYAAEDRMPVFWFKTRVRARKEDLDRWFEGLLQKSRV
jgi:hypothetical protein